MMAAVRMPVELLGPDVAGAPFREEYLAMARDAHGRGVVLMVGAVRKGLVTAWRIRPWNVVIR